MSVKTTFTEIRDFCKTNSDQTLVDKYSYYFKEGFKSRGVDQIVLNNKVKELTSREEMTLDFIFELARLLIPDGYYEEVSIAIMLLEKKKKQFTVEVLTDLDWWFKNGIENWAHTDYLGGRILNHLIVKEIITPSDLTPWLASPRKFQRRVVPVSLLKYMKVSGKIPGLLVFLEPLMSDKERVVHQGIGWFLREAWKIEPDLIENYLLKYRNSAARLIFQYATEKMDKEYRKKFRRDKK